MVALSKLNPITLCERSLSRDSIESLLISYNGLGWPGPAASHKGSFLRDSNLSIRRVDILIYGAVSIAECRKVDLFE